MPCMCGVLSATISWLHYSVHPPETACDWPCGAVILSHTQSSHRQFTEVILLLGGHRVVEKPAHSGVEFMCSFRSATLVLFDMFFYFSHCGIALMCSVRSLTLVLMCFCLITKVGVDLMSAFSSSGYTRWCRFDVFCYIATLVLV